VTDYGRKAKYYPLTRAGQAQLAQREKNWEQVANGVQAILRFE
jgi:DNA-binding PadR family transcriptional regulator